MLYVGHLYQARVMMSKLEGEDLVPPLDFLMYPILKDIFTAFKNHLKKSSLASKTAKGDRKSALMLMEDLQKSVMGCKKGLDGYMKWFEEIQQKLDQLGKKVKVLEKKSKKHGHPVVFY